MGSRGVLLAVLSGAALVGCARAHERASSPDASVPFLESARPEELLARTCSLVTDQRLCLDPQEKQAFLELLETTYSFIPVQPFEDAEAFLAFVEKEGGPRDLYPTLLSLLGPDSPLLAWTALEIPEEEREAFLAAFR